MGISIPVIRLIHFTGQWKIPFLKITIVLSREGDCSIV
jgi:hypothetical protein